MPMGIEHQLKEVKIPGLSALALSALRLSVKPVFNLQNSCPIGSVITDQNLYLLAKNPPRVARAGQGNHHGWGNAVPVSEERGLP